MHRLIPTLVLGLIFVVGASPGEAGLLDRTSNGDNASVTISSPFSALPPSGTVPYEVTIRNDRNAPGTWRLMFQGLPNTMGRGAAYYEQALTVAPNSTGVFDLVIPLPVSSSDGGINLRVSIEGPGFDHNNAANQYFAYIYTDYKRSGSRTPFTVIGKDVFGNIGLGLLENLYKDESQEFYGSDIDTSKMPSDWRAYAGVEVFILKDTEWLSLNPAQRQAVCDFVAQGGRLTLLSSEELETRTPELHLPEPDGKPGPYGFGAISLQSCPTFPADAYTLAKAIQADRSTSGQVVDQNFSSWNLSEMVGTIEVSAAFILSFVLLFGALVGPVNLFIFARGKKRFRLFWTTPLISIIACSALIAGILLTDGIGGSGKQMFAVISLPDSTREAVIQEQIARSAVLLSNRWRNDENYLITPISQSSLANAASPEGARYYNMSMNAANSPDTYREDGDEYSGNWFRSRSVSGQYLQAVRPSRSVLTVTNPQAFENQQEAPVVLSSFPQELTRLYLVDSTSHYWTCEHLEPGRKQTCTQSTPIAFYSFWDRASGHAGGKLRPLLQGARDRKDFFYATGTPPHDGTLATLNEIRWQVMGGVYLGPWVASPAPEAGP